ncbi:MAG: hypothetical protein WA116_01070 [Anaerolineaceae bacterium]
MDLIKELIPRLKPYVIGWIREYGGNITKTVTAQNDVKWYTYTPTWTASTTNPALGNGTLTGRYTLIGKTCVGNIYLVMGSTTTYSSGAWSLSLPFTAANAGVRYSGTWIIIDPGVANYQGALFIGSGQNKIDAFVRDGYSNYFSSTVPYTWGSSDYLILSFTYEIA